MEDLLGPGRLWPDASPPSPAAGGQIPRPAAVLAVRNPARRDSCATPPPRERVLGPAAGAGRGCAESGVVPRPLGFLRGRAAPDSAPKSPTPARPGANRPPTLAWQPLTANGWPSDWLVEAAAAIRAGTRYRPQAAAPACDPAKVPGPRGAGLLRAATGAEHPRSPPAKRSGLGARAGDPDPLRSRPPAPTDPSTSFSACTWWVPRECSTSEGTGRFPRWGRQRGLSSNPSSALFPTRSLALIG